MSLTKFSKNCSLFYFFFLALPCALASDYHSPRTAALGGSGRAGALLTDSIYLNPSYISFLPTHSLSLSYLKFRGDPLQSTDSDYYGRIYNIGIQDGKTEMFQAGVGFTQRQSSRTVHIGASRSFIKQMGFGLGAKILFLEGQTLTDATLAASYIANDWLQLAFVIDNLLESADHRANRFYREVALAAKFNIQGIVLLYLDPHFAPHRGSDQNLGIEMGAEFPIFEDLFFRIGHFHNSAVPMQENATGTGYGLGAGWIGGKLSIDYAFKNVNASKDGLPTPRAHTLGATVYF